MSKRKKVHTPNYYVRQRLYKNKPAMVGLFIILLAHIIAILGYVIMPDDTPYANDGSASIKKLKPGSEVLLLKTIKNRKIYQEPFYNYFLFGQESSYTILPIENYTIEDWKVNFKKNKISTIDSAAILPLTRPIFVGHSKKLIGDNGKKFLIDSNYLSYLDENEQIQHVNKEELIKEFKTKNIEKRTFWLGTDKSGRDILSRLLFGTRISLGIGFISVLISLFLGIFLGSLAGYFGGVLDKVLMWLMTVVWSIPGIMLVIAISLALHSRGIWVAFVAVGLTMWVEVARVVRGQILSLREKLYVEAATALGIGNMRIIFVHILPNIMGPIIVIASANFASAILIEAGLSFLGLGVQPPMPSWGMMVNEGYNSNWESDGGYLVIMPSLCICLLVLAFNLFGNGLRDAYDSQTATKW